MQIKYGLFTGKKTFLYSVPQRHHQLPDDALGMNSSWCLQVKINQSKRKTLEAPRGKRHVMYKRKKKGTKIVKDHTHAT